ncbi:hypothetical protein BDP81DRAFT_440654 [Colletotrichum phormii]|uniref:Uncharacterized protein n=1 Tax=Colletotrichum phormii TaxID=359342 RepID=A0AAJ0E8K8_9PEZI|nr:uncharacterized protein BDP81DRAFT_440654 [Colletotrichum phormii]KAK1622696.1 hypothetical protein BDP81DRAFT_440654 [Colletotrichum phormii]
MVFGTLYSTFPVHGRRFESRSFLSGLGNRIAKRKITDEKALEYFLHNSVEDPVRTIMDELKEVEKVKSAFDLGNGIVFENHPHAISDIAEEVVDRNVPSTPPSTPHNSKVNLKQLRADQICVYRSENDDDSSSRSMLYVSEYKPPHKLTAPHLRLGLRPMNIYKEVVNRKTIPTSVDPDARFQYYAERLTAAAISQTYHYMIEGGLEHGLLTTGEAIVFLKIDWREPETLFYHLAEPSAEVDAHPEHPHLCTAVAQYLAFSLIALGMPGERQPHGQDERRQAMDKLKTWAEDFETTLRSVPDEERQPPESSPGYEPKAYKDIDRSCFIRRKRRGHTRDGHAREQVRRDTDESSEDESRRDIPDTPTPRERQTRGRDTEIRGDQGSQGTRRSERILAHRPRDSGERGRNDKHTPYCTQKCLLGLVSGGVLDSGCPNNFFHSRKPSNGRRHDHSSNRPDTHHPINHTRFVKLLREQLEQTLDDGITPLGQGGARGVMFKVSLLAYSYTFVSKGTVRAFIKDLEHEAAVYERLRPIQGTHVPVFLGAIDLRPLNRTYYYDHRVYVVHMTFLSWGGHDLSTIEGVSGGDWHLEAMAMQSLGAIHCQGVVHKDVRKENMVFNKEINGIMVIDFERAQLLRPPRRALTQLVPNKRRWTAEVLKGSKLTKRPTKQVEPQGIFSGDIEMVKNRLGKHSTWKPSLGN